MHVVRGAAFPFSAERNEKDIKINPLGRRAQRPAGHAYAHARHYRAAICFRAHPAVHPNSRFQLQMTRLVWPLVFWGARRPGFCQCHRCHRPSPIAHPSPPLGEQRSEREMPVPSLRLPCVCSDLALHPPPTSTWRSSPALESRSLVHPPLRPRTAASLFADAPSTCPLRCPCASDAHA